MFFNCYSRIQYFQPTSYVVPRMSVIPQNMQQMRESIQLGMMPARENQIMKASAILETGRQNIRRNTNYRQKPGAPQSEELYLQYEDGCIYRGQGHQPSIRQGLGVLFNAEHQEVYSGEWQNNQYEGFGILNNQSPKQLFKKVDPRNLNLIEDGWKDYKGYFKANKMHGEGILTLTNGEKFEGNFSNGMIHGPGRFTSDRTTYGCWHEGILM